MKENDPVYYKDQKAYIVKIGVEKVKIQLKAGYKVVRLSELKYRGI